MWLEAIRKNSSQSKQEFRSFLTICCTKTAALYGCLISDELSIPEVCKSRVGTHLEEVLRRELGHQMGS